MPEDRQRRLRIRFQEIHQKLHLLADVVLIVVGIRGHEGRAEAKANIVDPKTSDRNQRKVDDIELSGSGRPYPKFGPAHRGVLARDSTFAGSVNFSVVVVISHGSTPSDAPICRKPGLELATEFRQAKTPC